jgi:protoporphyrinogen oxidase
MSVIIAGAGIGGLTAAPFLDRVKFDLLDNCQRIGGYASSPLTRNIFRRLLQRSTVS